MDALLDSENTGSFLKLHQTSKKSLRPKSGIRESDADRHTEFTYKKHQCFSDDDKSSNQENNNPKVNSVSSFIHEFLGGKSNKAKVYPTSFRRNNGQFKTQRESTKNVKENFGQFFNCENMTSRKLINDNKIKTQ